MGSGPASRQLHSRDTSPSSVCARSARGDAMTGTDGSFPGEQARNRSRRDEATILARDRRRQAAPWIASPTRRPCRATRQAGHRRVGRRRRRGYQLRASHHWRLSSGMVAGARQRRIARAAVLSRRRLLLGVDPQPPRHGLGGRPRRGGADAGAWLQAGAGKSLSGRTRRCARGNRVPGRPGHFRRPHRHRRRQRWRRPCRWPR